MIFKFNLIDLIATLGPVGKTCGLGPAGCYFPRGSVGIPHRKSINLTGNIDKTMHNR